MKHQMVNQVEKAKICVFDNREWTGFSIGYSHPELVICLNGNVMFHDEKPDGTLLML